MQTLRRTANQLKRGYSSYLLRILAQTATDLMAEDSILDVGCGHLRNLTLLRELGYRRLSGLDLYPPRPVRGTRVTYRQGDLRDGLPYPDRSHQLVLCQHVLMFLEPEAIESALQELIRVSDRYIIIETSRLRDGRTTLFRTADAVRRILDLASNMTDITVLDVATHHITLRRGA